MVTYSFRFGELEASAERARRQNEESVEQARKVAEQERLIQADIRHAARPASAYDLLRTTETQQREAQESERTRLANEAREAQEREKMRAAADAQKARKTSEIALEKAQRDAAATLQAGRDTERSATAREQAGRAAAEQAMAEFAKIEQDRQTKTLEQLAARSHTMMQHTPSRAAQADVREFIIRENRRIDEERRQLLKTYPGDEKKHEQFQQFAEQRRDAIKFPDAHLKDKTPEQINELAREGFRAEQAREAGKVNRPGSLTPEQLEEKVRAHNRNEAARARGPDDRAQLRPEQATTDTRGLGSAVARADARPAPRGEITDRRQREEGRPRINAKEFTAQMQERSQQKKVEHGPNKSGLGL